MKLFVVGANGAIGRQIVQQALSEKCEVTAFVRRADGLDLNQHGLHVVLGSVLDDQVKLQKAMVGHDAVISALGNGLIIKGTSGKILSPAMKSVIQAMRANDLKRLSLLMSYGAGQTLSHANLFIKFLGYTFFRKDFADLSAAEKYVVESHLDWTIAYFGALTDDADRHNYTPSTSLKTPRKLTISRSSVANFVLNSVIKQQFVKQRAVLSGRKE
ncbi:NAD(P)-binding oxidoreductase [Paenibacillus sp. BIHB 4019]|uniref:NAD(P)-dependent oxidoreductase n=1 Tax=Paenibacillus sp. BIHB 4019 TaxID=1870819 RepID=UPI000C1488BE|nr:NAD(P)-binding oxidoreductase [Paenibacillus sp. BIHB 4019]